MDERQRQDLWEAIDYYANHRTPASMEEVERVVDAIAVDFARFTETVHRAFAACEAKSPTPRSEDIVAANPMVPNANGDILPYIQFEVVAADGVRCREMHPREVLAVPEEALRKIDAQICDEILKAVEQGEALVMASRDLMQVCCPTCGNLMVPRVRARDGHRFWGCSTYPVCRGTRSAEEVRESCDPNPQGPDDMDLGGDM